MFTLFLSDTQFPKHSDRLTSLTLKNCDRIQEIHVLLSQKQHSAIFKSVFWKLLQGFWAVHLSGYAGFSAWASKSGEKGVGEKETRWSWSLAVCVCVCFSEKDGGEERSNCRIVFLFFFFFQRAFPGRVWCRFINLKARCMRSLRIF